MLPLDGLKPSTVAVKSAGVNSCVYVCGGAPVPNPSDQPSDHGEPVTGSGSGQGQPRISST
ncbi:hypothetical protein V2T23_10050 [Streptococcus agalactiae]